LRFRYAGSVFRFVYSGLGIPVQVFILGIWSSVFWSGVEVQAG